MLQKMKKLWNNFLVGLVTVLIVILMIAFVAFMFWLDKLRFVW